MGGRRKSKAGKKSKKSKKKSKKKGKSKRKMGKKKETKIKGRNLAPSGRKVMRGSHCEYIDLCEIDRMASEGCNSGQKFVIKVNLKNVNLGQRPNF